MSDQNLADILARQRARRNAGRPLPPPRARRFKGSRMTAVVTIVFFLLLTGGAWLWTQQPPPPPVRGLQSLDTVTPDTMTPDTVKRPAQPSPTAWTMIVCADVTWLHVRFGPDRQSSVRGYLRGGESVTILEQDGAWVKLSAPIAGWVDSFYLCQQ